MKIALIWPKGFDPLYVMPISLGYLKSNMSSEHEVQLIDCAIDQQDANSPEFRKRLETFAPDVVGVSCWSPTYFEAIRALIVAKSINPNVVTVIGGAHATSYPEKTMDSGAVDYLFMGESELSFPVFIEELQKPQPNWAKVKGLVYRSPKGLQQNESEREDDLDKIKIPDYDAMQLERYIDAGYRFNTRHKRNAPIWVTRGCPYRCGFCSAPTQNGKPIRAHSVEYMEKWIRYLYEEKGINMMNIIDDNFTFHVAYAKEFCNKMIDLKIPDLRFGTPNGIRAQQSDAELFRLMKKSGWENVVVAPESGSVRTLARMQKDLNPAVIVKKVKEIKDAGLKVHGFFIVGYPGETIEDIRETETFLRKCKFNMVFINNFQPLPGTPIYDELVASGEIEDGLLPKNYSSGERVYTPEGLKTFNFPRFVLINYLFVMLGDLRNVVYMLTLISPQMVLKKVYFNLKNMLFTSPVQESFHKLQPPMHS